ncbi:competence protein CoiA [Brevundimonas sp.]|uniref:competence protein CoiA n=1 Tax=Brevundimonas sp. TaxID=1871086 RepID=UPI0035AE6C3D
MQVALVGSERAKPQPKLKGICQFCGGEMIAKCGRVKVWHWSHKANPPCDPWWENETEWHRQWKNRFPLDWQEMVLFDQETGEKHVADVRTPHGLVIEFQHSAIKPEEIAAREAFYKNMNWIVDGTRGELDPAYFDMGTWGPIEIEYDPLAYGIHWMGRSRLFHNWGSVGAMVYLDFGKDVLFRLITFNPETKRGAVGPVHRTTAIDDDCLNGRPVSVLVKSGHRQAD